MEDRNNVPLLAEEITMFACKRAEEIGEEYVLVSVYKSICLAKKAIEDMALVHEILGEEKFVELGEALMLLQASKAVEEAEGFLKEVDEDG